MCAAAGSKAGYVYQRGTWGVGYYRDSTTSGSQQSKQAPQAAARSPPAEDVLEDDGGVMQPLSGAPQQCFRGPKTRFYIWFWEW